MKIKFRGLEKFANRIIFSHSFFQEFDSNGARRCGLLERHAPVWTPIYNNSVAQLATLDSDEDEVYTGEIVHADNGEDYFVELRPVFVNVDGGETLIDPPKHFTLKEKKKS